MVDNVDKVRIVEYISDENIHTICSFFMVFNEFAITISCPHFTETQLDTLAERLEEEFTELAFLWHHPAEIRYIGTHKTPSPGIPLLIIQSKEALRKEKARLKAAGYYSHWRT